MPDPDLTPRERGLVLAYRNRAMTVAAVLDACGAKEPELYRTLRKAREPFRYPALAKRCRVARQGFGISTARLLGLVGEAAAEKPDEPVAERLERLLIARIADLEDRAAPGRGADPEIAARALALNVRTLATLRRIASAETDTPHEPDASGPAGFRSLPELRDELFGHLDRVRLEERARRGLPPDGPDAEGDAASPRPLPDPVPAGSAPAG